MTYVRTTSESVEPCIVLRTVTNVNTGHVSQNYLVAMSIGGRREYRYISTKEPNALERARKSRDEMKARQETQKRREGLGYSGIEKF